MSSHVAAQEIERATLHRPRLRSEADIRDIALHAARSLPREPTEDDSSRLLALVSDALFTANSSVTLAHRGACCNLLSTLFVLFNDHPSQVIRSLVWRHGLWILTFKFAISHFSDSKPKPLKQLLGSLVSVLKKREEDTEAAASRKWLKDCFSALFNLSIGSAPPKGTLYAFTLALTKGILRPEDVLPLNYRPTILSWASNDELGPSLSSCIGAIRQSGDRSPIRLWYQPLIAGFTENAILQSCYRHYILPAIFSGDAKSLSLFLKELDFPHCLTSEGNSSLSTELATTTLLVASSVGLVRLTSSTSAQPTLEDKEILLPQRWLMKLLYSKSSITRLGSMAIFVGDGVTTDPLDLSTFRFLVRSLPTFFADTDADFRSDLLGLIQRMVERLRVSYESLYKHGKPLRQEEDALRQWCSVLEAELRPCATYQRHICALHCIMILVKSGIDGNVSSQYWSKSARNQKHSRFHVTLFKQSLRTGLLSLLLNPFDDIRGLAMTILRAIGTDGNGEEVSLNVLSTFVRTVSENFVHSGRADHADGLARAHALLFSTAAIQPEVTNGNTDWWLSKRSILDHLMHSFEAGLDAAEKSMEDYMQDQPLHSTITSIKYIIESATGNDIEAKLISDFTPRIFSAVNRTWLTVRHVLCNDAPEGFVPDEAEEEVTDMDSKSILSFCWRALKEASLLQRTTIGFLSGSDDLHEDLLSTYRHELTLGFTQLIELRHRGAFSTVAQTFLSCCGLFAKDFPEEHSTINDFCTRIIASIRNLSTINTRRSAGLPAALAGILAAGPNALFANAVSDLTNIASEDAPSQIKDHQALPQVHALNCLREVFKHSKLGQRSEKYIPQCLSLAGQCLTSDLWGVRNSGLMLFRSLIDRLLGTNESYEENTSNPRAQDLLNKYPELLELILSLLDTGSLQLADSSVSVEKVFPGLQILQRASPPRDQLDETCNRVAALTSSAPWHVRDKAAQTYARLQDCSNIVQQFQSCLLWNTTSENAAHGQLLTLKYMLKKQSESTRPEDIRIISDNVNSILMHCQEHSSQIVSAAAVDTWATLMEIKLSSFPKDATELHSAYIYEMLSQNAEATHSTPLFTRSLALASLYERLTAKLSPSWVTSLARTDADACVSFLDAAATSIHKDQMDVLMLSVSATQLIHQASSNGPSGVVHAAIKFLTSALLRASSLTNNLEAEGVTLIVDQVIGLSETPLLHDSALILAGGILNQELAQSRPASASTHASLRKWIILLEHAVGEEQPFDTRFAAVKAISQLREGLDKLEKAQDLSDLYLDLAILVYDLTNDDDNEVRDLAATTADRFWAENVRLQSSIPATAGHELRRRIVLHHKSNPHLMSRALAKLTNGFTPLALPQQDQNLFARERQNLYLDPAHEARAWSRVILSGMESHALQSGTGSRLQSWVLAGTRTFGTSLGWASFNPEVFTCILRLILSMEVLFAWRRRDGVAEIDPVSIRQALAGIEQGLKEGHPLLLQEAQRVLFAEVLAGMESLSGKLGVVPMP